MSAFALIDSIATDVLVSGHVLPEQVEAKLCELEKTLFEPIGRKHLEKLRACAESARGNPDNTSVFLDALDALSGHLESLNDARSGITRARHSSLYLQAVSLTALEPIEYDTTQCKEILDTFLAEYVTQLQQLEQYLWMLQAEPGRTDAGHSAFRIVHTMKGNCGVLEMNSGRKMAHAMENILARGHDKPLDGLHVELLLRAVDVMREVGVRMADHFADSKKPFPLVPKEFAPVLDLVRRTGSGEVVPTAQPAPARPQSGASLQPVGSGASAKVPLHDLFQRMIRVARDVARREEKEIDIQVDAEPAVRERLVPARLADPLLHLATNAVAHGAGTSAERQAAGKSARAQLVFGARLESGKLILQVSDDGAGLNCERILLRARERGMLRPEETLSEQAVYALIFMPGFSTKAAVSEIAGRGVGLDVVKTTIEEMGGKVHVSTVPGSSTTFELQVPYIL